MLFLKNSLGFWPAAACRSYQGQVRGPCLNYSRDFKDLLGGKEGQISGNCIVGSRMLLGNMHKYGWAFVARWPRFVLLLSFFPQVQLAICARCTNLGPDISAILSIFCGT